MLRERKAAQVKQPALAGLRMNFLGANSRTQLIAEDPQAGKVNYYLGNDPAKWHSNIPLFGRVNYKNIYPGVSLAFHGAAKQFEFDYLVSPGADPKVIALGFQGAKQIRTNAAGDLILTTAAGPVQLHKPIAYQEKEGVRELVDTGFVVAGRNRVAFTLGAYDQSRELVIDPTVTYSTYFGGGGADYGLGVAVDGSGDSFVTGATDSASLPGFSTTNNLMFDVFVTEINSSGTLVFTTLFGGSQDDFPGGIAVDSQGIYIAGTTDSSDFPTTPGVAQPTFLGGTTNGNNDAFAIKLDLNGNAFPTCSTCWATYIAGIESDSGLGIAVDTTHNVYVVGETFSTNLGGSPGGINPLPNGSALNLGLNNTNDDGYIVELNPSGTAYLLVSYLGGSNADLATGIALDATNNIYVSGETVSNDLPTTAGVVQPACGTDGNCNPNTTGPQDDAFVAAIKANLTGYKYVTYYGGSGVDDGLAIAVDAGGHVFLTGTTLSTDFKTAGTPFQSALLGAENAFVLQLNISGSSATHATYLGGTGTDMGLGIAVDSSENAYVTGQTSSSDFPTLNPTQSFGGNTDAFVSVLSASPNRLLFSTFLGGGGDEDQLGGSIAFDTLQNIYVTGDTDSGTGSTAAFPTKNPVVGGGTYGGGTCVSSTGSISVPCTDAFIAAYTPATLPDFAISAAALNPATVTQGGSATSAVTVTALNGYSKTVNLTCAVTGGGSPAPKCSLIPPSTSGGGSSTLTVTTTGVNGALLHPSNIFYATLLPAFGLSLMGIRFSYAPSTRKKLLGFLLLGMVISALFFLPACGGSSSSGGGGGGCTGCTPKGTYTVTVTGTDGTITNPASPALTLTVN